MLIIQTVCVSNSIKSIPFNIRLLVDPTVCFTILDAFQQLQSQTYPIQGGCPQKSHMTLYRNINTNSLKSIIVQCRTHSLELAIA
jgi:hypothetical protein